MHYYYVYRVTNNVNGKIYVGKRTSRIPPDRDVKYFGSGSLILAAIEKYGPENFTKEILGVYCDAESLAAAESEIVTEDFIARSDTYNLHTGGFGGWEHYNGSDQHKASTVRGGTSRIEDSIFYDSEWQRDNNPRYDKSWQVEQGKKALTPEARAKKKASYAAIGHSQGEKNSQFGTRWITNGTDCQKIPKTDTPPVGWWYGRKTQKST